MQRDWLRRHVWKSFPVSFYRRLYQDLLREGRVWDFHDIFTALSFAHGSDFAFQSLVGSTDNKRPLQCLMDDWITANGGHDSATLLALLRIALYSGAADTSMEFSKQLALTVMEYHPQDMDTEAFLQWMLMKTKYGIMSANANIDGFHDHLKSAPGLLAYYGWQMPTYIPVHHENPGWRAADAPAECQSLAQSLLGHCKRLGNYHMQADALGVLILISKDPVKELDELCSLQNSTQGNIDAYYRTLGTSYLALAPDASADDPKRNELKRIFRDRCFDRKASIIASEKFLRCLFLYSIEDEDEGAQKALEEAFHHSLYLQENEVEEFEDKMPDLRLKRLEYLKNNIGSTKERKEAERGLRAEERQREALGFSDFPELLHLGPLGNPDDEDFQYEGVTKGVVTEPRAFESRSHEDDEVIRHYYSEEAGYDSDLSKRRRREESRRRLFRRERERSRERWEEAMKETERKRAEETERELRSVRERIKKLKQQRLEQEAEGSEEEFEHSPRSSPRPLQPPRSVSNILHRRGSTKPSSTMRPPEKGESKDKGTDKKEHTGDDAGEVLESTQMEELLKKKQAAVDELRREEEERRRLETLEKELIESERKLAAERQLREDVERRVTQQWHKAHDRHKSDVSFPAATKQNSRQDSRRPASPGSEDSHDVSVGAPDPPQFGEPSAMPQMRRPPRHAILRVKRMRTPPLVIQVDHPSSPSSSSASSPAWASSDEEPASHGEHRGRRQLDPVVEEAENDSDEGTRYHAHVEEMDDSDDPTGPLPPQATIQGHEATDPEFEESEQNGDRESHEPTWDDSKDEELGPQDSVSATGGANGHLQQQNGKADEASGGEHGGSSSKGKGSRKVSKQSSN